MFSNFAEKKETFLTTKNKKIFQSPKNPVRVKGGMSLRNGMWHGLRNGIIMWNVIYAE